MTNEYVTFTLRLKQDDWEFIKKIAKENKRSMNKEIEYLVAKRIKDYCKENNIEEPEKISISH